MMKRSSIFFVSATLLLFSTARADAGTFATLSYNVRGLPAAVIEDRSAEIAAIAPRLEDFHSSGGLHAGISSVVLIQELFDPGYYATITNVETVSYANISAKDSGGPTFIGDGLNRLSDYPFSGFVRTQWAACFGSLGSSGSDCDTNKGFSYARHQLEPGVTVDIYNLHSDAGQDEGSRAARRDNIAQLIAAINTNSPPGTAVIVMGDTNSHYTRSPNDTIETLAIGTGVHDVWVELVNGGVVPSPGVDIDGGCTSDPSGANCELIDKIFYRSGTDLTLLPLSYTVLASLFTDGLGADLSDHLAVSVIFDYQLASSSTTTTTTPSTTTTQTTIAATTTTQTTTTTLAPSVCGDPVGDAGVSSGAALVTASDALFVLSAAVGTRSCLLCVCDVNSSGRVTATDALTLLRAAVGLSGTLICPPC